MKNKRMKVAVLSVATTGLLLFPVRLVFAGDEVQALKAQIAALEKRLKELESVMPAPTQQQPPMMPGQGAVPWDPFEEFRRMQDEVNRIFEQESVRLMVPVPGRLDSRISFNNQMGLEETKDGYVIKVSLGDADSDNIKIDVKERTVTVSGENSARKEQKEPNRSFQSDSYAAFLQTFTLPPDADVNNISTSKQGHVLEIRVPRKP